MKCFLTFRSNLNLAIVIVIVIVIAVGRGIKYMHVKRENAKNFKLLLFKHG